MPVGKQEIKTRAIKIIAIGVMASIGYSGNLYATTITFDSINTNTSPFAVDITSTNYLAQYGITLINNSPGSVIDVLCANASYNPSCTSGTGALTAESSANVLTQIGVNTGESYTLDFSHALGSLSFYTAGWNGGLGSGVSVADWTA